ncbi:LuxR family transcriptional regulator [Aliivibrio sp. S4TY2]|uniref:helix-turn-helix transcriptional regulator n=1 Tax=unclassified Aliivibrio TaxID=2645654 RepID=UPI002377ED42|nr:MULTISPECIES: LuxR family transcriptional regulator [unclassified Aliivibrio]MDD9158368.1 LuxR family transcriptional regulator [Aliivibrio sp. S4TY2]MDD9162385.1 LuxR family transcriptional regulator [Aliivibrio sp. S4TY1]MDD9166392.1 LuxR family transcriptional regulator [Aliivibrio sp. S4MY2]MDD9170390.1 LuxR family transcriptional regulator [Aliivibrio sp. S4MY4]MDD9187471.1 LuxR family transcriptional regulator [Aliivibrio sp. S4MY3]
MNTINLNVTLELINNIRQSQTNKNISSCLEELTRTLNCEYYLFAIINPKSMLKSDIKILDNYPLYWRNYYDEANLIKDDPIVDYSASHHSPINWSIFEKKTKIDSKVNVIEEAKVSGLCSGFSFPIHTKNGGFGMISFANSEKDKHIDKLFFNACMNVPLILPELLDSNQRITEETQKINASLTKREKECLIWSCEGKSTWEISKILGCSERTVTFHLANSQVKLGANNRCQSISKAILTRAMSPLY